MVGCIEVKKLVNHLVLGNHILLPGRLFNWLLENYLGVEDVLFEEVLLDELSRYLCKAQQWMI